MDWELWMNIATMASPIIGVAAIIVALWISHCSSRDAQKQIDTICHSTGKQLDAMRKQIDIFMASQAPDMVESLGQYEQQLAELDEQIEEAEKEYNVVNPFYGMGGARIDDIDYEYKKRGQAQNIAALKQKRKAINKQIDLINSFLRRK